MGTHDTADTAADPGRWVPDPSPRQPGGLRRPLILVAVLVLFLGALAGGGLWFLTDRYAGNIDRIAGVFDGLDSRPAAPTPVESTAEDPVTILLVGSDTRATTDTGVADGGRSDAIMIARFAGDREHAQLISIPRDSWVDIPGYGMDKINAAYAYGGPSLLIQTVEQLTGVRIDHYVAIDFQGIIQVTDDLGGVDVVVAEETTNLGYTFRKGVNHLDGAAARAYLGERKDLPGGDFDRVRRQQQFVEAVFAQLFSRSTFTDPAKLDTALRAVTSAVAVDDTLSNTDLLSLANQLRTLAPANVDSYTAPVLGTGMEGEASVVYLDTVTGDRMWGYLTTDSLAANADEFDSEALPDVPR